MRHRDTGRGRYVRGAHRALQPRSCASSSRSIRTDTPQPRTLLGMEDLATWVRPGCPPAGLGAGRPSRPAIRIARSNGRPSPFRLKIAKPRVYPYFPPYPLRVKPHFGDSRGLNAMPLIRISGIGRLKRKTRPRPGSCCILRLDVALRDRFRQSNAPFLHQFRCSVPDKIENVVVLVIRVQVLVLGGFPPSCMPSFFTLGFFKVDRHWIGSLLVCRQVYSLPRPRGASRHDGDLAGSGATILQKQEPFVTPGPAAVVTASPRAAWRAFLGSGSSPASAATQRAKIRFVRLAGLA